MLLIVTFCELTRLELIICEPPPTIGRELFLRNVLDADDTDEDDESKYGLFK